MTSNNNVKPLEKKDYFLRVGPGSELHKSMSLLLADNRWHAEEELQKAAGKKRAGWTLRMYDKIFDNINVSYDGKKSRYKLQYTDVAGSQQTVVNVQQADMTGGAGAGTSGAADVDPIDWPMAPPVIKPFDYFRKPSWYNVMESMTNRGRHIALAGPPGVGKDTAVMQLAATQGKPLVVVGGDAGLRKHNLVGTQEIVNGTTRFSVAEFAAAAVNGWWALITEVNAAEPAALMLLNGIIETPHIVNIHGKQYPVHPDFRLFISFNPGLIGTKPLPQSFKDRFFPIKVGFLSESELQKRLVAHGMPEETMLVNGDPISKQGWTDVVVKFGLAMWQAHEEGRMRYQITVRRLKDAVELMNGNDTNGDVKKALRLAVLAVIDSPVELKAAEAVLNAVIKGGDY